MNQRIKELIADVFALDLDVLDHPGHNTARDSRIRAEADPEACLVSMLCQLRERLQNEPYYNDWLKYAAWREYIRMRTKIVLNRDWKDPVKPDESFFYKSEEEEKERKRIEAPLKFYWSRGRWKPG